MACNHKFQSYLNLDRLDFEPTTLIIGTFNPSWPDSNYAEWFYGRTSNNYFWDVLPRVSQNQWLRDRTHTDWKQFCRDKKIALTDLVSVINDADNQNPNHIKALRTYSDSSIAKAFKDFEPTNITQLLQQQPTIKNVYLTTTIGSGLWHNLWLPIQNFCTANNINSAQLMTPSKGARFFMTKGSGIKIVDFIFQDWSGKWHDIS